jgi:hypothetical protein
MGFNISITRVSDHPDFAEYSFSSTGLSSGKFSINKITGDVELLEPAIGDEKKHLFMRASYKIHRAWVDGRELPEKAQWAS